MGSKECCNYGNNNNNNNGTSQYVVETVASEKAKTPEKKEKPKEKEKEKDKEKENMTTVTVNEDECNNGPLKPEKKSAKRRRKRASTLDLSYTEQANNKLSKETATKENVTREEDVVKDPPKKDDFDSLEKKLREFDFYHGFLPREDLQSVLSAKGDYLLRVSEIVEGENKVKREVILSLIPVGGASNDDGRRNTGSQMIMLVPGGPPKSAASVPNCRNVIIKRAGTRFFIEPSRPFQTVKELIAHYKKNVGTCNSIQFQLKNPILLQSWEFMHSDVTVGKVLGEGAFGKVCSGTLKLKDGSTVEVAIKMTKGTAFLSKAKIREMMNEARFIRNFNHKNVVRLYGVAHDEQPLYILLELVKGGSLKEYLQKNRTNLFEKIKLCAGAAKGIEYLHFNKCIHRDIAARNYLLSDNVVKITDFGLSRTGPIYKLKSACKLPTKWLSPEVLSTLQFSFASDVYSYGVTCYEIFADGVDPFEGMTNAQVKADILSGKFLQMPPNCPETVRKFITTQVFVEAVRRATMAEVVQEFDKMIILCENGSFDNRGLSKLFFRALKL